MTIETVSGTGLLVVEPVAPGDVPPFSFDQLDIVDPPGFYDIYTIPAGIATGKTLVCLYWQEGEALFPPRLLHYESGAWRDITTSVDMVARKACGYVTSLSPFVLVTGYPQEGLSVTNLKVQAKGTQGRRSWSLKALLVTPVALSTALSSIDNGGIEVAFDVKDGDFNPAVAGVRFPGSSCKSTRGGRLALQCKTREGSVRLYRTKILGQLEIHAVLTKQTFSRSLTSSNLPFQVGSRLGRQTNSFARENTHTHYNLLLTCLSVSFPLLSVGGCICSEDGLGLPC